MGARQINNYVEKILGALPEGAKTLPDDLRESWRLALQSFFTSENFVTRDEFDVQAGVLLRTREKLEALEAKLDTLDQ